MSTLSDRAIVEQLASRIKVARLARNQTQSSVAREAGVGLATLQRLEDGRGTSLVNFIKVLRALGLEDRLLELVPETKPGPIAQLEARERVRKRARGSR